MLEKSPAGHFCWPSPLESAKYPIDAGVHVEEFVMAAYVPEGHALQAVAAALAKYLPAGQAIAPVPSALEKYPG